MIGARAVAQGSGATRTCPHCRATILESAIVCPGCRHHLRFDKDVSKARVTALRGEVAKLRTELQSDLDARQKALEVELDKLLTEKQKTALAADYRADYEEALAATA